MSVYRCNHCENLFDADYVGCESDPKDDYGLVCLDCFDELDTPEERVETQAFRDFVTRMENESDNEEDGPGDEYHERLMERIHSA